MSQQEINELKKVNDNLEAIVTNTSDLEISLGALDLQKINAVDITTTDGNLGIDVKKINGTATSVNSGVKDAGCQRMCIATDDVLTKSINDNIFIMSNVVDGSGTSRNKVQLCDSLNNRVNITSNALNVLDTNSSSISTNTSNTATNTTNLPNLIKIMGSDTYTEATTRGLISGGIRNTNLANTLASTNNEICPLSVSKYGELYNYNNYISDDNNLNVTQNMFTVFNSRFGLQTLTADQDYYEFSVITGSAVYNTTNTGGRISLTMPANSSIFRTTNFVYPTYENSLHYFGVALDTNTSGNSNFSYEFGLCSLVSNAGTYQSARISCVLSQSSTMSLRFFEDFNAPAGITVTQTNFNLDKLNGTGDSGLTINNNLLNRFCIQLSGWPVMATFYYMNPNNGKYIPFHRHYNNVAGLSEATTGLGSHLNPQCIRPFIFVDNNSATDYSSFTGTATCGFICKVSTDLSNEIFARHSFLSSTVTCNAATNTSVYATYMKNYPNTFSTNHDNHCVRPLFFRYWLRNASAVATIQDVEIRVYYVKNATTFANESTTGNVTVGNPPTQAVGSEIIIRLFQGTIPVSTVVTGIYEFKFSDFKYFGHSYWSSGGRTQPMLIYTVQNNDATTNITAKIEFEWCEI